MRDSSFGKGTERSAERRSIDHRSAPAGGTNARRRPIRLAETEALRQENEQLRTRLRELEAAHICYEAHEQLPFGYLCFDHIGRILCVNSKGEAMLGMERGTLINTLFTRYLDPDSRNRFILHLLACRKAGKAAREFDLPLRTGSRSIQVDLMTRSERGDRLRYHTLIERSGALTSAGGPLSEKNSKNGLVQAVRHLKAQRGQLAGQNQRLRTMRALLQESHDRYAWLYEFSPVGYLRLSEDGHIYALNLTAAMILGSERNEITGRSLTTYVAERDIGRFEAHLAKCRAGSPQIRSELTLTPSTGSRDVELISVKTGVDDPEGVLYHPALMDITERKHAADALRESESKLRWLIDNMPAVLWTQDEKGNPCYVSGNMVRLLGYTEHEVNSGGADFWSSNIHPDDRERVRVAYTGMFSGAGTARAAAYDIEYRRQAKDGSWLWVVDRGMSVSEENGVRYATGMLWDTTRRKRMQEQLRESEERFRQLAENINDVFFLTDLDGTRIFYLSSAFERLWGFSTEALYAHPRSWLELIHAPDRRRVRRALKGRERDTPYDIECRIRRPNGALRWIRMRGFPILDAEGHVYRFAGIAADITARKEAADTLHRSHQRMRELALHLQSVREEERKRIAREIHDDLGALLLAIKMDLEATRKAILSGRAARIDMADSVARVDMAIDSVRRMATDLRPSILDQLGVLAAVEWQAQDTERRTGIKCDVEVDTGKDELDLEPERATAIFRIVQEALANVVRHSGATQVRIALHEQDESVTLEITDNGKGIDGDGASDLHKWGLIGMAERVASFKGRFGVTPAQPRGTTVSVWIPTAARPASHADRERL